MNQNNHPPDFTGKEKPPCHFCGQESCAWISSPGSSKGVRACLSCCTKVANTVLNNGCKVGIFQRKNNGDLDSIAVLTPKDKEESILKAS